MASTAQYGAKRPVDEDQPKSGVADFLSHSGEMGALIRAFEWSKTPLGSIESWSAALQTTLRIVLANRFPHILWWGPRYVQFYNDAYRPVLGAKHPDKALGRPGSECWTEIWHVIGPLIDTPFKGGPATWDDDIFLEVNRHGFLEETHFTIAYSPVPDEDAPGGIGGVLGTIHEITDKVVGERRVVALRDLGAKVSEAKTAQEACAIAAETLAPHGKDIPFILLYLLDADGSQAHLAGVTGVNPGEDTSPCTVDLRQAQEDGWPMAEAVQSASMQVVEHLSARFAKVPQGPWTDPPHTAVVVPIPSNKPHEFAGLMIAGVSARLQFDQYYRDFLNLVRTQVATAIANARAYEEERKRAEALAELDRAKTLFFSNVSHEFRTPLTLMLAPLEEAMAGEDGLTAENRERLAVAHRNSLRLLKLVNTLLDFSRIEAGRIEASFEPVDLAALTAELASVFRSALERAGLRLVVNCPPLVEPVFVDREMWEKVVFNLLSNAFKFTFEGEIEVSLRPASGAVIMAVRDTGTGIPPADLPHLFERFYRVRNARGRSFEGSGIGLALVQELVKLHGGAVEVESELGCGSTFSVSIPSGKAHLPADRIAAPRTLASTGLRAETYVLEMMGWLADGDGGLPGQSEPEFMGSELPAPAGTIPGTRPRILLADDNADMRYYVQRLLRDRYEVEPVADGLSALRAAREQAPDLVLTDVMMPGLDGFALLKELRQDERLKTVPVILLSARAGEEARVEGMEAGADDYLVKPFSARELLARVGAHVGLAKVRREAARVEQKLRAEAQAASEVLEEVLAGISDQFLAFDREWRCVFVNHRVIEFTGLTREQLLGNTIWKVFPKVIGTRFERELRRAMAEQKPVCFEHFYAPWSRWFENHVYPSRFGLSLFSADITGRKQAEQSLREADRQKDEFLAMLAHELRNPLAALGSANELLTHIAPDDPPVRSALETVKRQVGQLSRIIDDLLDVSRITQGRIELRQLPVDAHSIVMQALETAQPLIRQRGHRVVVEASNAAQLYVRGDPARLVQCVTNLLNNAAKYTPEGGQIAVRAAADSGDAVIEIEDNGIGIEPAFLPHVFDLFSQGDRSLDRSEGGLGIGLTLVSRLVGLHGGRIEAASPGLGRGSRFTIRLPRLERPYIPPESDGALLSDNGPRRRVLIVDDNHDAADAMAQLLELEGHHVHTVYGAHEALEAAAGLRPEIVLLDIGLPQMDGYEVTQRMRQMPELSGASIIAVTGYGQEKDRRRAEQLGFDHHLVKPVDLEKLKQILAATPAIKE
jgi:PAS domain S-box-containing protein